MSLHPQRGGARRSRWLALAGFLLMAGGWGAGAARADIYVHVMNCTDGAIEAQAFDAKDSVKAVGASEAKFANYSSGESHQLHCAGEGKGYCQMTIVVTSVPTKGCGDVVDGGYVEFHLDSGKWAVVTGVTVTENGEHCAPVVEKNLDSAPSSCS